MTHQAATAHHHHHLGMEDSNNHNNNRSEGEDTFTEQSSTISTETRWAGQFMY